MKKIGFMIFSLLIFSFLFTACNSSYEGMIDDFNEQYFNLEPTEPENKTISDSGFSAEKMLEKRYTFIKGYESSLSAPAGGKKYDWALQMEDGEEVTFESVCTERIYNFMPGTDIKSDVETTLVLTVTDTSGTEYIDTALIIVINRF